MASGAATAVRAACSGAVEETIFSQNEYIFVLFAGSAVVTAREDWVGQC
jgi:hypothetical protein